MLAVYGGYTVLAVSGGYTVLAVSGGYTGLAVSGRIHRACCFREDTLCLLFS